MFLKLAEGNLQYEGSRILVFSFTGVIIRFVFTDYSLCCVPFSTVYSRRLAYYTPGIIIYFCEDEM